MWPTSCIRMTLNNSPEIGGGSTYMSVYYVSNIPFGDELYHHGIKGQKWGVRRYQNEDGSLTAEGKRKYGTVDNFLASRDRKRLSSSRTVNTRSSRSKVRDFISKHKKGLAIAGGLLAAGTTAVIASKVIGSASSKKGADIVKKVLTDKDGYNPKGTVFTIDTPNGPISGYFSPEYADHLRRMNNGSLPGSHAKSFRSMTKELYDFTNKRR